MAAEPNRPPLGLTDVSTRRSGGSLMAWLLTESGDAYCLFYTPETAQVGGMGANWATIQRQGRKPLVRFDNNKVRTLQWTHPLSKRNWGPLYGLRTLMTISEIPQKYRLVNVTDDLECRGWWYVTDLQVNITKRDQDQQVEEAELTWYFIEANDERPSIAKNPPPPPPPPPPAVASPRRARTRGIMW